MFVNTTIIIECDIYGTTSKQEQGESLSPTGELAIIVFLTSPICFNLVLGPKTVSNTFGVEFKT